MSLSIPGFYIDTLVARGGMGAVYLAVEESRSRQVALKVLEPSLARSPQCLERFLTEALVTLSIRHPNVIAVHQAGAAADTFYLAMEYVDGGDMRSRIAARMSPAQALGLAETIGNCLAVLHQSGIVHGDIKPGNILFRTDDTLVLTDFGLATRPGGNLLATSRLLGTPDYLSPEQALEKPIDGRSDIYSLGVMLYEMLTGENPYEADTETTTTLNHLSQPVPVLPGALHVLQPLMNRMLADRPDDRFRDAAALVAYLRTLREAGLLGSG
jgi:serine/threonine protein kinase